MYYQKLYENYLKETKILKNYIKSLKKEASIAKDKENIEYRISILYKMYLDLKHTTEYLKFKCEVMKK